MGMLTYADNHAVGYFRKQGFKKQVTMKRERWQGYLKDYEGATLMECVVDPTVDYLSTRQVAEQQRQAVVAKIAEIEGREAEANGADGTAGKGGGAASSMAHGSEGGKGKDVLVTGWPAPELECRYKGELLSLPQCLQTLYDQVGAASARCHSLPGLQ